MSLPPDVKKAYGLVMAIGTKIGERARTTPGILEAFRAAGDIDAFRALVREHATAAPPAVIEAFLATPTEADWVQWRARLLVQIKMTRDGGKPAPGHEQGKGVGRP